MKELNLGPYPAQFVVVYSADELYKLLSTQSLPEDEKHPPYNDDGTAASTWKFNRVMDQPLLVVSFAEFFLGYKKPARDQIITHEAVHVWQFILECMRSSNKDDEVEAYTVAWLSRWMIQATTQHIAKQAAIKRCLPLTTSSKR